MKILIVGDDVHNAETIAADLRLRWVGVMVVTATDVTQAIELVETDPPDLVLLQPIFSDRSVKDFLRKGRRSSRAPVVVLDSQDYNETIATTYLRLGVDDYIGRPYTMTELMAKVWAILRRNIWSSRDPDGKLTIGSQDSGD